MPVPTGHRLTIASGIIALALLALTGFLLRDDIRWWWHSRHVTQASINIQIDLDDPFKVHLNGVQVVPALLLARQLIDTLPHMSRVQAEEKAMAIISEIGFVKFLSAQSDTELLLDWEDDEVLSTPMGLRRCSPKAWHRFLFELLRDSIMAGEVPKEIVQKIQGASQ